MKAFIWFFLIVLVFVFGCLENPAGQAAKIVPQPNAPFLADFSVPQASYAGQNNSGHVFNFSVRNNGGNFQGNAGLFHRCSIIDPTNNQVIATRIVYDNWAYPAGTLRTLSCSFSQSLSGVLVLRVLADASGIVSESNENNNVTQVFFEPQIFLHNLRGYPFDPNQTGNFAWLVSFQYGNGNNPSCSDQNMICSVSILNNERQWKDNATGQYISPPLYVPTQALTPQGNAGTDTGEFLDNTSTTVPGHDFFRYKFEGFYTASGNQSVEQSFLQSKLFYTGSDNINHSVPYYLQLAKDASSSFVFDGRIIYYASTSQDYGQWDGNATFSLAPISSSTESDFLVTASDGRHTMYWTDGNILTDPLFVNLRGQNNTLYKYYLYADNSSSGTLYLVLAVQTFNGLFDASVVFDGTDKTENGTIDVQYFVPNLDDFGGGINGQFFVAQFKTETGGNYSSGAENPPDFDTKIFIDTLTGKILSFPNNSISFYNASVKFNENNSDGIVKFDLDNDPATVNNPEKAYNDWGNKFEIAPTQDFKITVFDESRPARLKISTAHDLFLHSGQSAGTNDFNSFPGQTEFFFNLTKSSLSDLLEFDSNILVNGVNYQKLFKERILGNTDVYFDYLHGGNVSDLEAQLKAQSMIYRIDFGNGIPKSFQKSQGNQIIIPFFGQQWEITSIANQGQTITLQKLG